MQYKKYVFAFCIAFFGTFSLYFITIIFCVKVLSLPILLNAEIWLKDTYKIKDYINAKVASKHRLIIISDSNSLFGFNSSLIDAETKYTPINYATHGGLPINFHIDKIIANAKSGDVILLPLNFGYYTREIPKDEWWYIQNMQIWGDGYDKFITLRSVLFALLKTPPRTLAKNIIKVIKQDFKQDKDIFSIMEQSWDKNAPCEGEFHGYSYKSLNKYGDFCTQVNKEPFLIKNDYGLNANIKVSSFFISEFKRLQEYAKANNIRLVLTYPSIARNELLDDKDLAVLWAISTLKSQLEQENIRIYGDFSEFVFDMQYFYDTNYHLNKEGANLRTKAVIKLLQDLEQSGEL